MKQTILKIVISIMFALTYAPAFSQSSRAYIREAIEEWGQCRNVAITKTNGDVALYGLNGCARSNVPDNLDKALMELNENGELIDDIQLTESGCWLILYGDNGIRSSGIPYSLGQQLRKYNDDGEVINSVTFNDANEWIIVTNDRISSSDQNILDWLTDGQNEYGELWVACITDDCLVAVFERGYKFFGNVPDDLRESLKKADMDVYRLKVAGNSWFFADKNGNCCYKM